mmetsp:Transcript_18964/g.53126  ORF Transcript_18964/g.53126 Transcript_18964/m.53126 type:complete len:292 (+) Transcript_18964:2438-3313(+)
MRSASYREGGVWMVRTACFSSFSTDRTMSTSRGTSSSVNRTWEMTRVLTSPEADRDSRRSSWSTGARIVPPSGARNFRNSLRRPLGHVAPTWILVKRPAKREAGMNTLWFMKWIGALTSAHSGFSWRSRSQLLMHMSTQDCRMSMPTTSPPFPTKKAAAAEMMPHPAPTSSTLSPGCKSRLHSPLACMCGAEMLKPSSSTRMGASMYASSRYPRGTNMERGQASRARRTASLCKDSLSLSRCTSSSLFRAEWRVLNSRKKSCMAILRRPGNTLTPSSSPSCSESLLMCVED